MTFVGAVVLFIVDVTLAAPHSDAPAPKPVQESEENFEQAEPVLIENTSVTEVQPRQTQLNEFVTKFDRRDYYYPFRQSIFGHIGSVVALKNSTDFDSLMALEAGFMWQPKKEFSPKWEVGASWTSMGLGQLIGVRKHIYNEKGAFRPFYKYGFTLKIDPDEQSANLVDLQNFMLRAGLGLENILRPPRSVRMDLDLVVGQEDIWIVFQYGYTWGL